MKTRKDFFRDLHTQTIYEIKDDLLTRSQGSISTYNEIVNDYKRYIDSKTPIDADTSHKVTVQEFTDYEAKELTPFTADEIWQFDFEFDPPYRLVFDFITIELNSIKVSQLKVSCVWDKERVHRADYEKEVVRIAGYVYESFKFREACKLILSELLQPEKAKENPYLGQPMNDNAKKLFQYLIEHYRRSETTVVKYVNILHYLKNDTDKEHFIFKVKQDEYKTLVKEKIGIEIKKFAKSERYNEDEKPILYSLESSFLKNRTV